MSFLIDNNLIEFKKKGDNYIPYEKCYFDNNQVKTNKLRSILYNIGGTDKGTNQLTELFRVKDVFENPKPIELIKSFLKWNSSNEDIILDFFSGSATTAQACMQLNAEDNGNRKYIMVQIPKKTQENGVAYKEGLNSIDEIGRKRIELAAKKIKEETNADIDYGFKHYYVETPNVETIDKIVEFDVNEPKFLADDMLSEFSSDKANGIDTILTTWLINDGFSFEEKIGEIDIEGYKAHYVNDSVLYLINKDWGSSQTEKLLNMIGNNKLKVNQIILFGYSFTLESLRELETNIKNNVSNSISIVKRY